MYVSVIEAVKGAKVDVKVSYTAPSGNATIQASPNPTCAVLNPDLSVQVAAVNVSQYDSTTAPTVNVRHLVDTSGLAAEQYYVLEFKYAVLTAMDGLISTVVQHVQLVVTT